MTPTPDPKTPAPQTPLPRQLAMAFDSIRLRGMTSAERRSAVTTLAILLIEAAEPGMGGSDDGR